MIQAIDRRSLIAGLAAAGAFAMLEQTAAAASKPFFQRVGLPIGLQVYTLGDEPAHDLDATFATIASIGYREVELPSLYGRKPAEVRAAADKAGLMITSLHLAVTTMGQAAGLSLTSPPAEIAEALGALGTRRAVLPIALFPDGFRPQPGENFQTAIGRAFAAAGEAIWKRTAAVLNERAAVLKPLGVSVGYHNHNLEFAPIGKTNGWEILVHELDPSLVTFEVDIGWVVTGGNDPIAFLNRLHGRVAQLHVKDVAAANTTNFALAMKPAEVGAGTLDWTKILPAAHAAGVRHFYVEQEPPFTIPRMEAARRSHDFLARLHA